MDNPFKSSIEFKIADAKEHVDQIWRTRKIDIKDRFYNRFFHEICPLLSIAECVGDEETRVIFAGSESRFDGMILLGQEQKRQKVELSAAIDGFNNALQMELLATDGYAPVFQKIEAKGTKKNRQFGENESEATV
jgi:hypothetical protein